MQTANAERRCATHEGQIELLVRAAWTAADDVLCLELGDAHGADLPEWEAGAHLDLELGGGVTRQYSLCGDPADRRTWRIAVLLDRQGRGGSRAVHEQLHEGRTAVVGAVRNNFHLVAAPSYLFVAGGIGITPLLPMLREVESRGLPWKLVYGGRRRSSMAFLDHLGQYGTKVDVRPEDEVGRLNFAQITTGLATGTAVYACGPEAMLQALEVQMDDHPSLRLHVERFRAKPVAAAPDARHSFTVDLRRSRIAVTVTGEQSILEAVENAGIVVGSSCEEGVCGSCQTDVLRGVPDHRDSFLTEEERESGETMLICVSRSRSDRLELDL